jgi:hypothetical protein
MSARRAGADRPCAFALAHGARLSFGPVAAVESFPLQRGVQALASSLSPLPARRGCSSSFVPRPVGAAWACRGDTRPCSREKRRKPADGRTNAGVVRTTVAEVAWDACSSTLLLVARSRLEALPVVEGASGVQSTVGQSRPALVRDAGDGSQGGSRRQLVLPGWRGRTFEAHVVQQPVPQGSGTSWRKAHTSAEPRRET